MGEIQTQPHNDNDIASLTEKHYDSDNDIVDKLNKSLREQVLQEISEYKLKIIQDFMFGGPCKFFGDITMFIYPAIKQVERFTYIWMDELSEEARKLIINNYLNGNRDIARPYSDYLKSPVWKYISSIIKMVKGYRCEECNERYNPAHLAVHHRSYAHLGSELNHLDELAVLCNGCHKKIHGIKEEDGECEQ